MKKKSWVTRQHCIARHITKLWQVSVLLIVFSTAANQLSAVRIKEIANLNGDRTNQLIGFSLVVGLNGTGDSENSILSRQPLVNALERLGITLNPEDVQGRSVAAVMVSATLPAFAKQGSKVDILVSVLGDAITLQGGYLVLTPLRGPDREVYALAQGLIEDIPKGIELPATQELTGYARLNQNPYSNVSPTIGRISQGGTVEREIALDLNNRTRIFMNLKEPDFTNAYRVARIINETFGDKTAKAEDAGTIEVSVPQTFLSQTVEFIALIENLEIQPQNTAKVIIDERTGTIVMGQNIYIRPVAIAYKNLNLVIRDEGVFSKNAYTPEQWEREFTILPPANNQGQDPYEGLPVPTQEKNSVVLYPGGVDLKNIVDGLNKIGVNSQDLIDILKNLKAAGALQAEVVIR